MVSDHDPVRRGQYRHEVSTTGGCVDEHHRRTTERLQPLRHSREANGSGPGRLTADSRSPHRCHDRGEIRAPHPLEPRAAPRAIEGVLHPLLGGLSRNPRRISRRILRQPDERRVGDVPRGARRIVDRRGSIPKDGHELRVSRQSGDDEDVRIACRLRHERDGDGQRWGGEQVEAPHARPRMRR